MGKNNDEMFIQLYIGCMWVSIKFEKERKGKEGVNREPCLRTIKFEKSI